MMKVFGYSERECGGAVLAGYRPVSYIGFAIGTAYQYGLIKMMVSVFYDSVAVIPEHNFDLPAFFITLALFILFYESVMKVYTVRLRRIPIKEVMEE
ncbi:MAG TPA: hypothetical protein DEQ02_03555 [Ruminococcaceae bacterium]|nr:hypothetical protein [Oscillospiraceae bacterium]